MKKIFVLMILVSSLILDGCLKKETFNVEEFSNNNINDIVGVWYRYIEKEGTRDVLKKVELDGIQTDIDSESREVTLKVSPSQETLDAIPAESLTKLSLDNVGVVVAIPTAARIFPLGESPKLGVNGDWTQPNHYIVEAGNGDKAEWIIHFVELNK